MNIMPFKNTQTNIKDNSAAFKKALYCKGQTGEELGPTPSCLSLAYKCKILPTLTYATNISGHGLRASCLTLLRRISCFALTLLGLMCFLPPLDLIKNVRIVKETPGWVVLEETTVLMGWCQGIKETQAVLDSA